MAVFLFVRIYLPNQWGVFAMLYARLKINSPQKSPDQVLHIAWPSATPHMAKCYNPIWLNATKKLGQTKESENREPAKNFLEIKW